MTFAAAPAAALVLRAAAVVLRGDCVLLHRAEQDAFWSLPGGRIEAGETSDQTLARELVEELGIVAPIGRLVWLVEHRFEHSGKLFQEIGFYFLVDPETFPAQREGEFRGAEPHLILRWFDRRDLADVDLRPAFLRQGLNDIPSTLQHIQAAAT